MTAIRIKGLDKAVRDLKKKGEKYEDEVKAILSDLATDIELRAVQLAPSQIGGQTLNIKQRIDKVPENNGLTWKIGVQGTEDFDAYLEFGTGLDAKRILSDPRYTDEIRDLAYTFYKNGLGTLPGRPYLFPAWFQYTANIVEDLKKQLAKVK